MMKRLFLLFIPLFFLALFFSTPRKGDAATSCPYKVCSDVSRSSTASCPNPCTNLANTIPNNCYLSSSLCTGPAAGLYTCNARECCNYTGSCSSGCVGNNYFTFTSCTGPSSGPSNYCSGTWSYNDPRCTGGTCIAGTGTTNASCGGNYTACQCNGSTCQTQGYYCSAGNCVKGWAGGSSCPISSCPIGSICNPGGGGGTPCNSGISCTGSCTLSSGTCGTGTQTCTYTTLSTGGSCTPVAAPSQSCSVGCPAGYTCSGGTCVLIVTTYSISGNVYDDYNGNMVKDAVDTNHASLTVTLSTGATTTSDTSGNYTFSNLNSGSYSVTLTVPATYTLTTPPSNPTSTSVGPSTTVNFGIKPPAPTCSGGLTANPTSVNPGGTSTLTAVGCTSPTGGAITYTYYDDSTIAGDSVTNNNTNTSTWTSPNPYWTQTAANPSVAVCNPGGAGALCSNYGAAVTIIPVFSITGNVFVDQNKDQLLNGSDVNYTGGISISPNPAGATVTYPNPAGNYLISGLTGGNYTIYYNGPPVGYQMTYPQVVPPPSFSVRVGNASTGGACTTNGNLNASCDANGNISALRYGITNSIPWIQSTGGDITGSNISNPTGGGFSDPIPSGASCGTYASLNGAGGTPGIIHSGAGSYSFGSGQASPNPSNWVIGGSAYPDTYVLPSNVIRTSYNYVSSIAKQSGITPTDISSYCGAGGIANCVLSGSLSNGVYIANGSLTLTGASYTFPANKNFVILVNGNLNIQTEVHVPVGSTAFFTSSGDIYVDSGVGEAVITSIRANVEGYFSSDRNFIVQSLDSTGKGLNCPTSDRRLNVAGAIVVNAALGGGSFTNQRDLCLGNLQCPAFMVTERPDFILNTPDFFKTTRRVWQEIAP